MSKQGLKNEKDGADKCGNCTYKRTFTLLTVIVVIGTISVYDVIALPIHRLISYVTLQPKLIPNYSRNSRTNRKHNGFLTSGKLSLISDLYSCK